MREIKFRGLRIDGKGWVYGDFTNFPTIGIRVNGIFNAVIPETVGQYTGLKDKNNAEIFKGDKASDGEIIYEVEWNQQNTQFCLNPLYEIGKINNNSLLLVMNYQPLGNGYLSRKDLEVVGNIHEKP